MYVMDWVAAVVAVLLCGYLLFAMLFPERFV